MAMADNVLLSFLNNQPPSPTPLLYDIYCPDQSSWQTAHSTLLMRPFLWFRNQFKIGHNTRSGSCLSYSLYPTRSLVRPNTSEINPEIRTQVGSAPINCWIIVFISSQISFHDALNPPGSHQRCPGPWYGILCGPAVRLDRKPHRPI